MSQAWHHFVPISLNHLFHSPTEQHLRPHVTGFSKKIQLFIVSDANIVLKLHCSVEYSWWKRASRQGSMKGGVLDGTGLKEPPINKALLRFCFSDHERRLPPNGALTITKAHNRKNEPVTY